MAFNVILSEFKYNCGLVKSPKLSSVVSDINEPLSATIFTFGEFSERG